MPLRALLATALLFATTPAVAKTYVDEPALGHTSYGVGLYGGAPLGPSDDPRASVLGGGGSELLLGYAWTSGVALHGVFGAARWSSRGPLAQTLRDRDAALLEGYAGLAARWVLGGGDVAPFASALLLLDVVRVSGDRRGDASGLAVGGQLGMRFHDAPWDVWAALDLRHARLSSPFDDVEPLRTTRLSVTFGVFLDGALR